MKGREVVQEHEFEMLPVHGTVKGFEHPDDLGNGISIRIDPSTLEDSREGFFQHLAELQRDLVVRYVDFQRRILWVLRQRD